MYVTQSVVVDQGPHFFISTQLQPQLQQQEEMVRMKINPRRITGDGKITKSRSMGRVVRRRRFRSGTVALREIKKYQKSTELLISKVSFQRLVREIFSKMFTTQTYRIKPEALLALQEASEDFLVRMFSQVNELAIHRNRVTITPKDTELWNRLMNF